MVLCFARRLQQASSVDDQGKDKDASFRDDIVEVLTAFIATLFNYLVCFDFDKKLAPNMLQLNHLKVTSVAYTL